MTQSKVTTEKKQQPHLTWGDGKNAISFCPNRISNQRSHITHIFTWGSVCACVCVREL